MSRYVVGDVMAVKTPYGEGIALWPVYELLSEDDGATMGPSYFARSRDEAVRLATTLSTTG